MGLLGMRAGNERVQALDPVHEPMLRQEVERTVGDRWLRSESRLAQHVQDCIGPKRPVLLEQQLQHLPPHRRQAQILFRTARLGGDQRPVDAGIVIMRPKSHRGRVLCGCRRCVACHVVFQCYNVT